MAVEEPKSSKVVTTPELKPTKAPKESKDSFFWSETQGVHIQAIIWSIYSDLRGPKTPNGGLVREISCKSGKSRLVKYYNLARIM